MSSLGRSLANIATEEEEKPSFYTSDEEDWKMIHSSLRNHLGNLFY